MFIQVHTLNVWPQAGCATWEDSGNFKRWDPTRSGPSLRTCLIKFCLVPGPSKLCFLSSMRTASLSVLLHSHDAPPEDMVPSNRGPRSLKPWASFSSQSFVLGTLSHRGKANWHQKNRVVTLTKYGRGSLASRMSLWEEFGWVGRLKSGILWSELNGQFW